MSDDQAVEQSLEDRIGNMFDPGGSSDEAEVEQEASPEEQPEVAEGDDEAQPKEDTSEDYQEVEYEGEVWQVPTKLAKAIMQERDYTQKTQQLADQRRALELQQKEVALWTEQQKFGASVAEDSRKLELLDEYIKHVESTTDWKTLTTDEIVRARFELDQLTRQKQELQTTLQGKYQEFRQKQDLERSKIKQELEQHLAKSIPSWSSETKGAIEKYVQSNGYPEMAVQNMSAMDYQVAWKAMQFDKLQAEKGKAVSKAAKAPPVVKPGAVNPMPKATQDKLNFRKAIKKASTSSDKARLIEQRLAKMF